MKKKKTTVYQTKTFKLTTAQENHFQVATIILDYNHLMEINIAEDQQTEQNLKFIHKRDIADQLLKKSVSK